MASSNKEIQKAQLNELKQINAQTAAVSKAINLPSGKTTVDESKADKNKRQNAVDAMDAVIDAQAANNGILSAKTKAQDNVFAAINNHLTAITNFITGETLTTDKNSSYKSAGANVSLKGLVTLLVDKLSNTGSAGAPTPMPMGVGGTASPGMASQLLISFENTGDVIGLLEAVTELEKASHNSDSGRTAIETVSRFLESIYDLSELDRKERKNARKAISWIKKYIASDMVEIIEELDKTRDKTIASKDTFISITHFFKAITMLTDVDKEARKNMKKSIRYINNYIAYDVVGIIEQLEDVAGMSDEALNSIRALESVFKCIISVADLDNKGIRQLLYNINVISSLFEQPSTPGGDDGGAIYTMLDSIGKAAEMSEEQMNSIKSIKSLIDDVLTIGEEGMMSMILLPIKVNMMTLAVDSIKDELLPAINNISDIDKAKTITGDIMAIVTNFSDIVDAAPNLVTLGFAYIQFMLLNKVNERLTTFITGITGTSYGALAAVPPKFDNIKIIIEKLIEIFDTLPDIPDIYMASWQFSGLTKDAKKLKTFLETLIDSIDLSSAKTSKKLDTVKVIVDKFVSLSLAVAEADLSDSYESYDAVTANIEALRKVIEDIKNKWFGEEDGILQDVEPSTVKDWIKTLKPLVDVAKQIAEIAKELSIAGPAASIVNKFGPALKEFPNILKTVVDNFNAIDSIKEDVMNTVKAIGHIIMVSSLALLVAGLIVVTKPMVVAGALAWGVVLGLFVTLLLKALSNKEENKQHLIEMSMESAKSLSLLLAVCTLCLLIPGLIITMKPKIIVGTLAWAIILDAFIIILVKSLSGKDDMKMAMSGAKDLAILIGAISLCLLIPGLIITMKPKIIFGTLAFGLILWGFIEGLTHALSGKGGRNIRHCMMGAKELAILIGVISLCLLVPGLIITMKPKIILGALAFGLILWGFIEGLTHAFSKKNMRKIAQMTPFAYALMALTAVCGIILLSAGAVIAKNPDIALYTLAFAGILIAYFGLIGLAVRLLDKIKTQLTKAIPFMMIVMGITTIGVLSLTMIRGVSKLYGDNPVKAGLILLCFTGSILALAVAYSALSIFLVPLGLGTLSALAIMGITLTSFLTFTLIRISLAILGGQKKAKENVTLFGDVITSLASSLAGLAPYVVILPFSLIAAGFLSAIIFVISVPLMLLAKALNELSKVRNKKLDIKPILSNIDAVSQIITFAVNSGLTNPLNIIRMYIVEQSVTAMTRMMGKIAAAVQDYAELKVPVGWDNKGKVTEYRHLKNSDFKNAAKNVKTVITVLGGAVMDVYNANPDMFSWNLLHDNPFVLTVKSTERLAKLISKIASAVKCYASMMIPLATNGEVEVDKDGKPKHFTQLTTADYTLAATNVSNIITVLSKAVMDVYNANPDMFDWGFAGFLGADNAFVRTVKSTERLSNLIHKIASSVKSYASMLIPIPDTNGAITLDKDGKPKHYRTITNDDFVNAAHNITSIISVMGQAIMDEYETHKTWYEDTSLLGVLGMGSSSNTPFAKTIKQNMKLATLITKIACAVKTYASLLIPIPDKNGAITLDKDGRPKNYRTLEDKDFLAAARNVKTIMSTLGQAIVEVYEANPDMYDDGWFSDSPFVKCIKQNTKLASLISKIAASIKSYASMIVPMTKDGEAGGEIQLDKDGKPTRYRTLKDSDFKDAARNIKTILSTLGNAIIETYKANEEMYDDGMFSDSPFEKCVKANNKMAKMISKLSEAIKDYYELKVPKYNKDGEIEKDKFTVLKPQHFSDAASNIELIITTLGESIITTAKKHEDWFDDGEDSDFAMVCAAISTMGTMIGNIADGVGHMASLEIPIEWKDGKAINYRTLNETDFTAAETNISTLVSNLGKTIMKVHKDHPEWFDDGEDSDFAMVMAAVSTMGEGMASIVDAIANYAELKVPTEWKDGKPVNYKQLDDTTFTKAATNIGTVISTMAESILKVYFGEGENQHQGLSQILQAGEEQQEKATIFATVMDAIESMSDAMGSIASGIADYANAQFTDENGKVHRIGDAEVNKASEHIKKVIETVATAIVKVYDDAEFKEMFKDAEQVEASVGLFGGDYNSKPVAGTSPFAVVMNGLNVMGSAIGSIASGLVVFANDSFVDPETKETKKLDFDNAQKIVNDILLSLPKTVKQAYTENTEIFQSQYLDNVLEFYKKMSGVIKPLGEGIQMFALMRVPDTFDDKGMPKTYITVDDTMMGIAQERIVSLFTALPEMLVTAVTKIKENEKTKGIFNPNSQGTEKEGIGIIFNGIARIVEAIKNVSDVIGIYASGKIPVIVGYDKNNQPKYGLQKLDKTTIADAGTHMSGIIEGLITAISTALVKWNVSSMITNNELGNMIKGVTDITSALVQIADLIKTVSEVKLKFTNGNTLSADLNDAMDIFIKLDSALAKGSYIGVDIVNAEFMGFNFNKKVSRNYSSIADHISNITDALVDIASGVKDINKISIKISNAGQLISDLTLLLDDFKTIDYILWDYKLKTLAFTIDYSNISSHIGSIINILRAISFKIIDIDKIMLKTSNLKNISTNVRLLLNTFNDVELTLFKYAILLSTKSVKYDPVITHIDYIAYILKHISMIINGMNKLSFSLVNANDMVTDLRSSFNTINTLDFILFTYAKTLGNAVFNYELIMLHMTRFTYTLLSIFNNIAVIGNTYTKIQSSLKKVPTTAELDNITKSLKGLSKFVDDANKAIIGNGGNYSVDQLYEKVLLFKAESVEVKKFVTTINAFNTVKAKSVQSLVESLYKLAGKMDMAKLAEVLDKKLNGTLIQLTKRIQQAEKTILKAEEIQKNRHKAIEKSISKVSELMNTKLFVEVSQKQEPVSPSTIDTDSRDEQGGDKKDPVKPGSRVKG